MLAGLKQWLRNDDHPLARVLFRCAKTLLFFEIPAIKLVFKPLFACHLLVKNTIDFLLRVFYYTPMFKTCTSRCGKQLYLYGGIPYMAGPLDIQLGDRCRMSGVLTITGRGCAPSTPQLIVGSNVDIGWSTTIAVGTKVVLGDNVRMAGGAFLAGYPGHPVEAEARAAGKPELDHQAKDIILEDDVWIATNCSIMAGVTIGKGTIVAAGSVVTQSLPAGVLAGGVPAKVIKTL